VTAQGEPTIYRRAIDCSNSSETGLAPPASVYHLGRCGEDCSNAFTTREAGNAAAIHRAFAGETGSVTPFASRSRRVFTDFCLLSAAD
jgi:hypothetical protein